MTREISNNDDIIDSREVIERIDELEALEGDEEIGLDESEAEELRKLRKLAQEGSAYSEDWRHGSTLIRESHFVDYAKQYAEEVADGIGQLSWPFTHIDWDGAAEDLKGDYAEIDFDGVAYLVR